MSNLLYANVAGIAETGGALVVVVEGEDWSEDETKWEAKVGGEEATVNSAAHDSGNTTVSITTPDITSLNAGSVSIELAAARTDDPDIPMGLGYFVLQVI